MQGGGDAGADTTMQPVRKHPQKQQDSHIAAGVPKQVRDRATLYLAELDGLAGGPQAVAVHWGIPAKNLEKSLRAYLENGTDAPFDLVPAVASTPHGPCALLLWGMPGMVPACSSCCTPLACSAS